MNFSWSVRRICRLAEEMQKRKFDCFIVIEGNRGLGKSTLGYLIANGIRHFHKFNPKKDIQYRREEIMSAIRDRWYSTIMADEMINVSFNRDFYQEDQKRLIKLLNMNRDHRNVLIACVPKFQTLDNQIKNLCKIRITVLRRGKAIVQTQNRTIYNPDAWDTEYNHRIERSWFKNGMYRPKYSELSTFRGVLSFGDLTPKQRLIYEQIKYDKRNLIKSEQESTENGESPYDRIYTLLDERKITSRKMFDTVCFALGMKPLSAMSAIRSRMRNKGDERGFKNLFSEDYKKIGSYDPI